MNKTQIKLNNMVALALLITGVLVLFSYPFLADESSEIGLVSYVVGAVLCFVFSAVFYLTGER